MMMVVMMAAMTVATASCGDDEESGSTPSAAGNVAGDYSGVMNMSLPAMPGIAIDPFATTVKIAAGSDGTATLTLPGASYNMGGTDMVIAGFTMKGVSVASSGNGAYTIGPAEIDLEVDGKEYRGALNGTVTGGKLALTYSLKVGKMPFDLVFKFIDNK